MMGKTDKPLDGETTMNKSPSNVYAIADASIFHDIAAVRDVYVS